MSGFAVTLVSLIVLVLASLAAVHFNGTGITPVHLSLALAVIAVLIVVLIYTAIKSTGASKGQPTVLIVGPSDAGKTSLYLTWQNPADEKKEIETVTSVMPNESAHFSLSTDHRVIDCPGNEKLLQYTRAELKNSNVKAIIYMVDASSGPEGIKESARPLFSTLAVAESKLVPVMIAANKFDLFSALSVTKIRTLLEQELSELRDTQSRTVLSSEQDDDWEENTYLGVDGKKFEFGDLETEVEVADGSVKAGRVNKWENWLEQVLSQ